MVSLRCLFDWFVQLVVGGGAALRCYRIELVLVSGARDMCIGVVVVVLMSDVVMECLF